ncbi:MAG: phage/plasmid primase, P4 family [Candidatus Pacearchaeota archaeon]|nr:phage/plasmid primase, P4 family [Candidatus Pacearchaeota archaeon]
MIDCIGLMQCQNCKSLMSENGRFYCKERPNYQEATSGEQQYEETKLDSNCAFFEERADKMLELEEIKEKSLELLEHKRFQEACWGFSRYLLSKYHFLTFSENGDIYVYDDGVYTPRGKEKIYKEVEDVFRRFSNIHAVSEITAYIRRNSLRDRDEIEEPIDKICLKNGILNIKTMQVEQHSPSIIFFNKVPVSHIPAADCPKIKKFLSEIINEDSILTLQELVGYCLYKRYSIHKAVMLVGTGANGKSTFLRLLKLFLGVKNVTSVPLQSLENNRFSLSSLFGKLANVFADLSNKALVGTSYFKMLCGEDLIPAEKKFQDQFFFTNYAKMIFSANQIPKSPEDTDAFFRRWIIINFPNQFLNNADKNLIDKIATRDELSGFLNFAIEGLKRLLEQGDFTNSKSIKEVREQYIRMSDSVGAFVMDMVLSAPDEMIAKKEIYTKYGDYCRKMGYPVEAENTFHKELQKEIRVEDYRPSLYVGGKKERVQCWKGIKIKYGNSPDNTDTPDTDVNLVNDVKGKSPIKILPEDTKLEVTKEKI